MTLLGRMTGYDPGSREGSDFAPSGRLTVTDTAAIGALAAAGRGVFKYGGGYAAAVGIGAGVCAAVHVPLDLDLLTVGVCLAHGAQRASEGFTWHLAGGRAAERRRRKYQGEATPMDVRRHLSPSAAQRKMARLAPGLPASRAFISFGSTVYRPAQRVGVSYEESVLLIGVPRSFKTALMSHMILNAPGAVLATSSRGDQWGHTVSVRERMGEVHVLDADGHGPGTNFAWDPVSGCEDPDTAIRRAGDFMHASPRDPGGKDSFHEDRGVALLQQALHAAALSGKTMLDVRDWVGNPDDELFLKALSMEGAAYGWAEDLVSVLSMDGEYLNSSVTSAQAALGWLRSPSLAALACPPKGEGLDIAEFLRKGSGTIYLIGKKRAYGSLTPFFTAFASEFLEQASHLAERQGGRLPVPLLVAADEAATTARIDFERWLPVTAGYNITVAAGLQAISQLESNWGGPAVAETILTNFSTKVIGPGMTNPAELQRLSTICGERDTWRREHGARVRSKEFTFPPERIKNLPDFNVLVVPRSTKPVQVRVNCAWDHPAYQKVVVTDAPEPAEQDVTEPPEQEAPAA